MPYPAINYTWKYKFLILTVILLVVCFLQAAIIKKERLAHKNEILEIESRNMEQKNKLIEKARALEIKINKQLAENSVIKERKMKKFLSLMILSMVILTGCNSLSNKQLKPTNVNVQIPPPPKLSKKLLKYQPQEEVETLQQKWQKTFNDYLSNAPQTTKN